MFPQIKIKGVHDLKNVKKLKRDLNSLKTNILKFAPPGFGSKDLNHLRIRVFKFPENEDCNEFFTSIGSRKYVCLNSDLLNKNYFVGLQYGLHGITHNYCFLNDNIGEEIFCEVISYDILKELLKNKNDAFKQQVFRKIMQESTKDYNTFYRVGRRLERKRMGFLCGLNNKACIERISGKDERRIFYKLIKPKTTGGEKENISNLEKGFKRI